MANDTYRIGEFEFDPISNRLRHSDESTGPRLGNYEGRILRFLIKNFGNEYREGFKEELIAEVWKDRIRKDMHPTDDNVYGYVTNLRRAFREKGEYILTGPYRLGETPIKIDPTGPSLTDRREFIIDGLGVAAALRFGRCLVSVALRNQPVTGEHDVLRFNMEVTVQDPSADMLSWYLFPLADRGRDSKDRVAIMTATDDRFDPISPRKFSESGSWVATRYIEAFRTGRIEQVDKLESVIPEDALVLLGSHEVNPKAREFMGNPDKHSPIHRTTGHGYEADLPWAIYTPEDAREVHILQTREHQPVLRKTKEHIISCLAVRGESLDSSSQ